jgi:membrane fusion protein, multidrug efflux system
MRHIPLLSFIQAYPKRTIVIVLAIIAIGFGIKFATSPGSGEQQGGMAVAVETAPVEQAPLITSVNAAGSLLAQEGVLLRPEIAGVVSEILFTEGEVVTKGQPLIRLDDSVYKAQLGQAQAEVSVASKNLERVRAVVGRGAGTQAALDEASARQQTATATLKLAEANMNKSLILAPFAGTVGIRQVNVGDYVSPGQTLVSLQALDMLKVDFAVPETVLASLKVGQPVSLTVSAYPSETFTGTVSAIDPLIDPNTRSIKLRALIPNNEGKLRPGLFAAVTLTLATEGNVLFVPSSALYPMGDQQFVFLIKEGKTAMTPVSVMARQANRVALSSGVTASDQVVTAGHAKIMMFGQGQPVDALITNAPAPETKPEAAPEAAKE